MNTQTTNSNENASHARFMYAGCTYLVPQASISRLNGKLIVETEEGARFVLKESEVKATTCFADGKRFPLFIHARNNRSKAVAN
jgi:hypothetical protein